MEGGGGWREASWCTVRGKVKDAKAISNLREMRKRTQKLELRNRSGNQDEEQKTPAASRSCGNFAYTHYLL